MTTALRFARFNLVGAAGIAVQLATIWLLIDVAGAPYLIATALGVMTAVAHNFVWHVAWTWRDRGLSGATILQALLWFVAANGVVSFAGNMLIMTALVEGPGLPVIPANVIAIGVCGLVNFWLADRLAFTARPGAARYSSRSAVSGSTRAARRAGITPASRPTIARTTADPISVTGSRGDRPYSSVSV
jgi:putative flippase GtrA